MADLTPRQFEGTKDGKHLVLTPKSTLKEPRTMTKFDKNNPEHVNLLKQDFQNPNEGKDLTIHPGGYFSQAKAYEKKTESKDQPKAVAAPKKKAATKQKVSPVKPGKGKSTPAPKRKSNIELAQERELEARKDKRLK